MLACKPFTKKSTASPKCHAQFCAIYVYCFRHVMFYDIVYLTLAIFDVDFAADAEENPKREGRNFP